MARLTRRGFVKVSGVLAAPALTAFSLRAQGQAPDTGNLRVEKDIVFGKGGGKDLTLDVYRPPAGVTSKRTAIVHLFGGGFFVGNKNAGYIINDAKALGAEGTRTSLRTTGSRARACGRRRFRTRRPRFAGPARTPTASASIPTGSWLPATRPAECCRSWPPQRTGRRSSRAMAATPA